MLLLVLAMADAVSGAAQSAKPAARIEAIAAPTAPISPGSNGSTTVPTDPAANSAPVGDPSAPQTVSAPAPSTTAPPTAAPPIIAPPTDEIAQPRDPWVKLNRGIFSFDIALERAVLAPVSHGYVAVVPHVVRYHVTNALFNLGEPLTAVNDLLQLRIKSMGKTVFRFVVNSTFGVAGLFDIAKSEGVPIHISDFGQTLGRYGAKPGPYVMIPLLGPSDVRDGFGRIVDSFADPVEFFIGGITSNEGIALFLLEGLDWRSRADDTLKAVYGATDPYAFARSAYTQSRAATVAEATGKQAALPDFDATPEPANK